MHRYILKLFVDLCIAMKWINSGSHQAFFLHIKIMYMTIAIYIYNYRINFEWLKSQDNFDIILSELILTNRGHEDLRD